MPQILSLIFTLLIACSSSLENKRDSEDTSATEENKGTQQTGSTKEGNDDSGEFKPAGVPVEIAGINLTLSCSEATDKHRGTELAIGCQVNGTDNKAIDLSKVASSYNWKATFDQKQPVYQIETLAADFSQGYHAVYYFQQQQDLAQILGRTNLIVSLVETNTGITKELSQRALGVLKGLSSQRHIRVALKSIISNPNKGDPVEIIEFKVDGEWLRFRFDFLSRKFYLGDFEMKTNAGGLDLVMLAHISGHYDQLNPNYNPLVGEFTRYDINAPHDYKTEPLYLATDFGKPVAIRGVRYKDSADSTKVLTPSDVRTGFPDWIHFDGSDDGKAWSRIPGSDFRADDSTEEFAEYLWAGSDL